ncbi:S-layer homology domain-containing protein [Thermoanaerobacterium sp. DL9XJH110]|uniref:S-layer homology domain-containing protein n=1 Tax=Thermoanaerobacterium sp. DL9XJH110 TaxID=3386643 RepID=UPI003BB6388A
MRKLNFLFEKKFLVICLAGILVLVSTVPAMAVDLKFKDITSRHQWARPYIEKMYLAGVTSGVTETSYAPESPVKRAQIIAMLVRLMGLENEAKTKSLPADFPKADAVPAWARGYVAVAVEKGIISGKDLDDFRPDDDAKRYEVAVFAVKALGLGEEAESRQNVNLSFKDIYAIPLDARSYVEIAVEKKILQGYTDNNFKPNNSITRAEAAKVLFSVAKHLPVQQNVVRGRVEEVDPSLWLASIKVKLQSGNSVKYSVNNSASIYKEDEKGALVKANLEDIKIGDNVEIIPDRVSGGTAAYIEKIAGESPSSALTGTAVEGTIADIDIERKVLTVKKSGGFDMVLNVKAGAAIYLDGKSAGLSDLAAGQPVSLLVSGTDIIKLEAKTVEKSIKGILKSIIGSDLLVIDNDETGRSETYSINSGVLVVKDGQVATLANLVPGDLAGLTIAGGKVVKIEAESAQKEVKGIVENISFLSKNPVITVEDEDGDTQDIEIDGDVSIKRNGRSADIDELKKGDEVDITLEYNKAIKIVAKSVKRDTSGRIKSITLSDNPSITIIDEDGEEITFYVTSNTDITQDSKEIKIYDLKPDYQVDIRAEGDEATSIKVTAWQATETFKGTVQYIHTGPRVIVISIKKSDGTRDSKEIHYDDDTVFIKGRDNISVRKINVGDEIIAVGAYDSGLFTADSIVVLTN